MIEIKSVTKKYEDFTAIENISFTVENCSVTGLCGFNGAGKTTTLKSVVGILGFDEGEILIDGNSIKDKPIITVYNKIDKLENGEEILARLQKEENSIFSLKGF